MTKEIIFMLTIEAQDMVVHYRPNCFASLDYAHFEFNSPHTPRRRIPVSETGYRSHFSPMDEIEAFPSVQEYARMLALALMGTKSEPDEELEDEQGEQLTLF